MHDVELVFKSSIQSLYHVLGLNAECLSGQSMSSHEDCLCPFVLPGLLASCKVLLPESQNLDQCDLSDSALKTALDSLAIAVKFGWDSIYVQQRGMPAYLYYVRRNGTSWLGIILVPTRSYQWSCLRGEKARRSSWKE